MSRKLLYSIIVVLIITNIAALLFGNKEAGDNQGPLGEEDEEKPVEKEDDQVASVEGEEILYKDWIRSLRNTEGKSHLEELINQTIVKKLAEEKEITISDKVIDREIAYLTTMSGTMDQEEMDEQEEEWEEEIRYRYQLEALLTEDVAISDDEVEEFYNQYENQYDFSTSFQLSHIIVPDMDTAEKVMDELDEGASFDLLAKEYSTDDETQDEGGYLGYFTEDSQFIPPGYDEIIENMDEFSYSEPFSIDGDVGIIYLHRYLPEITFSYDELKPSITRELAMEEIDQNEMIEELWEELDVEWIYD